MKKLITMLLALSLFTMNVYATGETCSIDPFSDYEWKAYYKPGTKDTTGDLSLQVGDTIFLTKDNEYLYLDSTTGTSTDSSKTLYYRVRGIDGTKVLLEATTPVSVNYSGLTKTTEMLNTDKATCINTSTIQSPNKWENACNTCFSQFYDYQAIDDLYLDSNNPNDSTLSYYEKLVRAGLGSAVVKADNLETEFYNFYKPMTLSAAKSLGELTYLYKFTTVNTTTAYIGYELISTKNIGSRNVYYATVKDLMQWNGYTHDLENPSTVLLDNTNANISVNSHIMNANHFSTHLSFSANSFDMYYPNFSLPAVPSSLNIKPLFTLDFATLGISLDGIN